MTGDTLHCADKATAIDWTAPIEAYRYDGQVMHVVIIRNDGGRMPWHVRLSNDLHLWSMPDGNTGTSWRIRNVVPLPEPLLTPTYPPEVVERMVAFVRDCAGSRMFSDQFPVFQEARAIVALLPEPVDPDHVEARMIAQHCGIVEQDERAPVYVALAAALRRGRELARLPSQDDASSRVRGEG